MKRPGLMLNDVEIPWSPRQRPEPPAPPAPRQRIFDHLTGDEPEDKRFSTIARQMRKEQWWTRPSIIVGLDPVSGELP